MLLPVALAAAQWQAREAAHRARVDAWTQPHLARSRAGRAHPVHDFLFTYYSLRPARLRRWHPGTGAALLGPAARERLAERWYAEVDAVDGDGRPVRAVGVDGAAWRAARGRLVELVRDLLAATAGRAPQLGCFGLHEWAMVHRVPPDAVRHEAWPLRLGSAGTDAVVESSSLRCTHADAFRFFTPAARPRNALQPQRSTQVELEQPGCLHAAMDCYKWAYKLGPVVPGELLADCFALARELRELDMRASPYDLTALGYEPVRVETPEGRAQYAAAQRAFVPRSQALRTRLLEVCAAVVDGR